jgi:nucleoside-diphosphate-sugar epimerase
MNIFITGASGVVGRRLVPMLARDGHALTGVSRSPASRAQLERAGAAAVELDLFNPAAVTRAIANHDAVINLATHIPSSSTRMMLPWSWRENDRLRREASRILADACIRTGVLRFIQESFAPVYKDRGDRWIDEAAPIASSRYNRTVADAEASAERVSAAGRSGIVLRFGMFYGPDSIQTRDVIGLIKKGWAPLPGAPDAYMSSVSHDDAAAAAAVSVMLPSGIYNVVDDEPVTHRVFVDSLADTLGVGHPRLLPRWMTPLLGSTGEMLARSVRISNRKLREASGWAPEYPSVRQGWRAVAAELDELKSVPEHHRGTDHAHTH